MGPSALPGPLMWSVIKLINSETRRTRRKRTNWPKTKLTKEQTDKRTNWPRRTNWPKNKLTAGRQQKFRRLNSDKVEWFGVDWTDRTGVEDGWRVIEWTGVEDGWRVIQWTGVEDRWRVIQWTGVEDGWRVIQWTGVEDGWRVIQWSGVEDGWRVADSWRRRQRRGYTLSQTVSPSPACSVIPALPWQKLVTKWSLQRT